MSTCEAVEAIFPNKPSRRFLFDLPPVVLPNLRSAQTCELCPNICNREVASMRQRDAMHEIVESETGILNSQFHGSRPSLDAF